MNRTIEILNHNIDYWYTADQEMPDHEQGYVNQMINQRYIEGQLIDTHTNKKSENIGYWKINNCRFCQGTNPGTVAQLIETMKNQNATIEKNKEIINEMIKALKLAPKIAQTLMDEAAGTKSTDWGIVNDGLMKIKQVMADAQALKDKK